MAKNEEQSTEVATQAEGGGNAIVAKMQSGMVNQYSDLLDLADNMDGVEARLPQISIVHQGQMFKFSDSDRKVSEIVGIILDTNRSNAWWAEPYTGENTPPSCLSLDGIKPMPDSELRQADSCLECPMNQFGSEIDEKGNQGAGKACKNMRRIHILLEGSMIPYRLTLPPSGLKAWDQFATALTGRALPYQAMTVKITLREAKNKGGIIYSEPVFAVEGEPLSIEQVKGLIVPARNNWLSAMRGQLIDSGEI